MAKRFDLIVFDWDGTLLDSAGAIVGSIMAACADIGIAPPPEERARHIIGLGLRDALMTALPELPAQRYPELADRYRFHYLSRDHELTLFAGLDRALASSGIGGCFQATRCADECHSKPHPQMLEELMASLDVAPEQTLMIGDTTHDLQMAANAGVAAVAVAYGAHPRQNLESLAPIFCADSMSELAQWLMVHG
jgi:phosphoglycolate phosphatase